MPNGAAAFTNATLQPVMKNRYLGPVQRQLADDILVHQLLQVDKENLDGLKGVVPLHVTRSDGIGARGELEDLPPAGAQGYDKAEYNLAYHYGRIQVSGQAIHHTNTDAGAFLRALQSELDRIRIDLALDFARQTYGDGTGAIAQISTGVASATQTLTSEEAIVKGFLYVGMAVDVGTIADPDARTTAVGGVVINDLIPGATPQVVLASSITSTTNDFIFRRLYKASAGAGVVREMDAGLQKLITTSTSGVSVGGIDPSTAGKRFWDNIRDTSASAIGLSRLMKISNRAVTAGAKAAEIINITSPGGLRLLFEGGDFASLGTPANSQVRFVNTREMKGGFEEISFAAGSGSFKMVADRLAPWGKVLGVHRKSVRVFSPADWDYLARDGLNIRWVAEKDAWQSILFKYANMGTNRRNTSYVLSFTGDSGV